MRNKQHFTIDVTMSVQVSSETESDLLLLMALAETEPRVESKLGRVLVVGKPPVVI